MTGTDGVIAGELLPALAGDRALSTDAPDRLRPLVAGWLIASAKSVHTRTAYQADIGDWLAFCAHHGIEPLEARKTDVDAWHRTLAATPSQRTGRPLAPASLARKVSAVASFYGYLVDEDHIGAVPVRKSSRPKAPTTSSTVSLSKDEALAVRRRCLEHESPRDRAVVSALLLEGLRVDELSTLDVGSVGFNRGHTTMTVIGKGDKQRVLVVGPSVVDAIGTYLAGRAEADGLPGAEHLDEDLPLFVSVSGGRLTQRSVMRMVQRIARAAGVPSWRRLSPHSLRHTCATMMLDAGVPIDRVQDHLGHADTRTTRRYDASRQSLDRSGVYELDRYLAVGEG